jgi:glutaryl-CoA dehydrogenase
MKIHPPPHDPSVTHPTMKQCVLSLACRQGQFLRNGAIRASFAQLEKVRIVDAKSSVLVSNRLFSDTTSTSSATELPPLRNAFDGGEYEWNDPFQLNSTCLTADERAVREAVRTFAESDLFPQIAETHRNEATLDESRKLMRQLGDFGLLGATLPEAYTGNPRVGYVSYGLMTTELERIDSSYRSAVSVQSSLVMYPIAAYAQNDTVKKYLLPQLASGHFIGCFGLTEPNHGSDPGSMETKSTFDKGTNEYILNGTKAWITNSPIADILIIWAKNEDGIIKGYIVERESKGLTTTKIGGKFSLRASCAGMITLDNVRVPAIYQLNVDGLKGPFSCLNHARYGISWGVLGAADFCLAVARQYCLDRTQFGQPLASKQLIQKKLADMSTDIAVSRQACYTVGRLMESGKARPEQVSMIKRQACGKALDIARAARDMLGANGICDEYHVIRHVLNLESVSTYEGTSDIHALILGRAITGISAF